VADAYLPPRGKSKEEHGGVKRSAGVFVDSTVSVSSGGASHDDCISLSSRTSSRLK